MASKALPSPSVLRQLLRYEPETGRLFWRERGPQWFQSGVQTKEHNCAAWNKRNAGREAFTAVSHGYRIGAVFHRNLRAHRVIWAMTTGVWPSSEIDHINHNRQDNRISNLREVSGGQNSKNMSLMNTNTSGACGVAWHRQARKWRAYIGKDDSQIHLGLFATKVEAIVARNIAARHLGFHENHGGRGA